MAATLGGGIVPDNIPMAVVNRVPNATEVALGNLHIPLPFVPVYVIVTVWTTATRIAVAWNGAWALTGGSNPRVTLDNAGVTESVALINDKARNFTKKTG